MMAGDSAESRRREENREFLRKVMLEEGDRRTLQSDLRDLDLHLATEPLEGEQSIRDLRRGRERRSDDPVSVVSLLEDDGVLRWETGPGFEHPHDNRRRGRRRSRGRAGGTVVTQLKFEDLPPNRIDTALVNLDGRLTPNQGLHLVEKKTPGWRVSTTHQEPVASGKILLLVHGTFSKCEKILEELTQTNAGTKLLDWADSRYDQILAFNHPTLSVSPVLNASDLAQHFDASKAEVDIVCHSRGGLVSRWWNERFDRSERRTRIVFVGSPLAGTSLASPHNLKNTINLLTNVSRALTVGAQTGGLLVPMAAPFFTAAAGLLRVFTSVTTTLTKVPLLDAGVALVPGLAGQSRQGANSEILRLREGFATLPAGVRSTEYLRRYYFIASDFEPDDPGWRFWKYFNKKQLFNAGADRIFERPNDLVVDTDSMSDLVDAEHLSDAQKGILTSKAHRHMFPKASLVHHTNYFQQAKTIEFLREKLSG